MKFFDCRSVTSVIAVKKRCLKNKHAETYHPSKPSVGLTTQFGSTKCGPIKKSFRNLQTKGFLIKKTRLQKIWLIWTAKQPSIDRSIAVATPMNIVSPSRMTKVLITDFRETKFFNTHTRDIHSTWNGRYRRNHRPALLNFQFCYIEGWAFHKNTSDLRGYITNTFAQT